MEDRSLLLQMMDACRPSGRDLGEQALSPLAERLERDRRALDLFERVQQLDAAISTAVQSVPVPEGLAARIMARLDIAAQPTLAAPHLQATADPDVPVLAAPNDALGGDDLSATATVPFERMSRLDAPASAVPARMNRRRWLTAAGVSSLAAGVLGGAIYLSQSPRDYTPDELRQEVLAFHANHVSDVILASPPAALPPSKYIPFTPKPRAVTGLLGRNGVVYRWSYRGTRVSLYAVRMRVPGLSKSPFAGQGTATGLASAAWQEGGLVYVLVVDGPVRDIHSVLKPQQVA